MEKLSITDREDRNLNLVDLAPKLIEVKEAALWKKKDMSKVKDFKLIEVISDWTYSTPYKGSVHRLSKTAKRIQLETSLQLPLNKEASESANLRIEDAEQELEIPVSRLGRDNPILHFAEVYLYEDDLGDQGYTACTLRYRVMGDCFYILHRYYLRVDEVLVRIFDTRLFHSFDTEYVIREFQYKESTYDELRAKGFKVKSSEWSLSKQQADEVFP
jgi:type 2A phosphatase activator TIP41